VQSENPYRDTDVFARRNLAPWQPVTGARRLSHIERWADQDENDRHRDCRAVRSRLAEPL
jgi:hypothetical protein